MASHDSGDAAQDTTSTTAGMDIQQAQPHRTEETAQESTPVEMSNLEHNKGKEHAAGGRREDVGNDEATVAGALQPPEPSPEQSVSSRQQEGSAAPPLQRQETEALGPATEDPKPPPKPQTGPTLLVSLMLTTGARHPYKIDEKYLRARNMEARDAAGIFDPRELSGYKLKELIWTDWRQEWEPRPSSPSAIRLIIMGRMVEDNSLLKDFPFTLSFPDGPPPTQPNVLHMTVKPADLMDDEADGTAKGPAKRAGSRAGEGEDVQAGCCRCIIQ